MSSRSEPTLYRKYRPQTFAEVVGQDHVVRVLSRACVEGRVAHAYLFAGPRGTGKTTMARLLAKRLNCEVPNGAEPCGRCSACVAVARGMHLDLIEIDAASTNSIDDIRALKERINLQPAHGHWKVYILDEVHMLGGGTSKGAANALLKTLEEPPSHAVFVLATTELDKVPETIRSRCQTFVFRRAPVALVIERLETIVKAEGIQIAPEALNLLATSSGGCFRDAESLLAMVATAGQGSITVDDVTSLLGLTPLHVVQDFVDALLARDARRALALLAETSERGSSLSYFTETLSRYVRALASHVAAGVHAESFAPSEAERFTAQAALGSLTEWVLLARLVLRAKYELRDTVYDELPLELLALEWCARGSSDAPSSDRRGREAVQGETARAPARAVETPQLKRSKSTAAHAISAKPSAAPDTASTLEADGKLQPVFQRVLDMWASFLRTAASLHPLLLPMLREAVPVAIRERTLFVLTDHPLAHDRLRESSIRMPLEERLEEVAGEKLAMKPVRSRDLSSLDLPEPSRELRARIHAATDEVARTGALEPSLTDALSILGGELVDKQSPTP